MANVKSAKKRIKTIAKKSLLNKEFKTGMRTAIKKTDKAILSKVTNDATSNLNVAIKKIDTACSKGLVSKNFAARQKSRLTKNVNKIK